MDQATRQPATADDFGGPSVRLKRHPERGAYDSASVFAIIDEALIGHVSFVADGQALTLPTAHARLGDQLYLHGAQANRMLRALCESGRASVTFTLIDGLVLARTAFHHSMNFRSVTVFGSADEVTDSDEKLLALQALIDHMAPGRMRELGMPSETELTTTRVVRIAIEQASAKVRTGHPLDAPEDRALPVWAGTVPLRLLPSAPVPDSLLRPDQPLSNAAAARALSSASDCIEHTQDGLLFSTDPSRLQFDYILQFLRDQSYWAAGIDASALHDAMRNSLCFGVYRSDQQVGFARIISDRSRLALLFDVFIERELRGQGVGRALLAFVLAHPTVRAAKRCLLGTADAHGFYQRLGFERIASERFMARARPSEEA